VPDDPDTRPTVRAQGLFPAEREIARRLSQSEKRWRAIAKALEPEGLPAIDPLFGGRFWPAIVGYLNARYGVGAVNRIGSVTVVPGPPDGEEHWDAP
jgi:hypothetical protein